MITLQFGQFGNQLSPRVLDFLYALQSADYAHNYFRESPQSQKLVPRAVMVDTEPKAIQRSCLSPHPYEFLK